MGNEGVVAVEDVVRAGLGGSFSSRFLGRRDDRKIFLRPARARILRGDFGGVLGTSWSEVGDKEGRGERGVDGAGNMSEGSL